MKALAVSFAAAPTVVAAILAVVWGPPPTARADTMAYLVNVTVRPGYNFANAEQALSYGHGICDKLILGRGYGDLITDIKGDVSTGDYYQASYLIAQAVNELCPAQIWQLRNSAAGYGPAAA